MSTLVLKSEGAGIVQICSWCLPRTIRVLGVTASDAAEKRAPLGVQEAAHIRFELDQKGFPKSAYTVADGRVHYLRLSHGICPECRVRLRPEPARLQ